MADSTLGLLFEIGADPSKAITGMEGMRARFGQALNDIESRFSSVMTKTLGISKEFAVGVGVAGGAVAALGASLFALAHKAAEAGTQIFEASEKTGLAAANLSGLAAISKITGENFDSLAMALGRAGRNLTVAMAEPASVTARILTGVMGSAQALTELGLKPMDERIQVVLQRIFALNDAGERNAALNALLGRGWMSNFSTLQLLANEGYGPAIEKAKEFGMYFDAEAARKARDFTHAWNDLTTELKSLSLMVGQAVLPAVSDLMKHWMVLLDVVRDIGPWNVAKGATRDWGATLWDLYLKGVQFNLGLLGIDVNLVKVAGELSRSKDYSEAWGRSIAKTDHLLKTLSQETDKNAAAQLNLGKATDATSKVRELEMLKLRLLRQQYLDMEKVVKGFSGAQNLYSQQLLARLQREIAAIRNWGDFLVDAYRQAERASRHWAEQIRADFQMVMAARRLDQQASDAAAREKQASDRAEEQSKKQLVDSVIGGFQLQGAAHRAVVLMQASLEAGYETAEAVKAIAKGDWFGAIMHGISAAKFSAVAATSLGGGGSRGRASIAPSAASGSGAPTGPPALAPGAVSGQQGGTVRVVVVSGDAAGRAALAQALNYHARYEGGQVLATKTLAPA